MVGCCRLPFGSASRSVRVLLKVPYLHYFSPLPRPRWMRKPVLSVFRGREDVYAERWRAKDGTWAYRPAGEKDWAAVLASRPENRKKVDRQTRTRHPLTDEFIRLHLKGRKTIGIYPLLLDETCWFLAADF